MKTSNKLLAEFFGTFWLVFGGCGSAVLASAFFAIEEQTPINLGIGLIGVSLAFGLTVLTMAFAIGHTLGVVPRNQAEIIVAGGNFHGRTITVISLVSSCPPR